MANRTAKVRYADGAPVKHMKQSEYLGTLMNDRGDPNLELKKRITVTMATWKN